MTNTNKLDGDELNRAVELALGDDLSCFTPGRVERHSQRVLPAVEKFLETYEVHPFVSSRLWSKGRATENTYIWQWCFWLFREGEPWQADIETHVAAYLAEPRPFATDIGLCFDVLVTAMNTRGLALSIYQCEETRKQWRAHFDDDGRDMYGYNQADSAELAICRAFLAVTEAHDGNHL